MEKSTIKEAESRVLSEFKAFEGEWLEIYELLISKGKLLEPYPEEKRTDDRLIKGCQSRVWLDCTASDGVLSFTADSDTTIAKGIISILVEIYSGHTAEEILASDFSILDKLHLNESLNETRKDGMAGMVSKIRDAAREESMKPKRKKALIDEVNGVAESLGESADIQSFVQGFYNTLNSEFCKRNDEREGREPDEPEPSFIFVGVFQPGKVDFELRSYPPSHALTATEIIDMASEENVRCPML